MRANIHESVLVNPEDFELLTMYRWTFIKGGYFMRGKRINGKDITILLHRLIAERMGLNLTHEVDHINGIPTDNRRENLRPATRSQNCANRFSKPGASSDYLGVTWHKRDKKWTAHSKKEGKKYFAGYHATEIEASYIVPTSTLLAKYQSKY